MSNISIAEFEELMRESLPFAQTLGPEIVELSPARVTIRLPYRSDFLRPGGTISGPMLMGVADLALYAIVLAAIGRVELAVTTSLTINFLRKPPPMDIIAHARLLKLGKRLAVGEVDLFSADDPAMVAHVVGTYSIPPRDGSAVS
jgi:uncharacterized protein (TIGR00369 family)